MTEIELKFIDIDAAAIEARLVELGAEKVFDGAMQATMYDFPGNPLYAEGSLVRLRSHDNETEFVFKKRIPSETTKSFKESQVLVSDRAIMHDILLNLGMVVRLEGMNSHRTSYALGNAHYELDTIEGLPTYLEVEVHDESELKAAIEPLGLRIEDGKAWSRGQVQEYYESQRV
jgi:predicted adenylyl cyclase CyaB